MKERGREGEEATVRGRQGEGDREGEREGGDGEGNNGEGKMGRVAMGKLKWGG